MDTIKLVLPTEEYLDQVWAYRQECIDAGSSMDGCGPLRPSESKEQWLAHVRAYMDPATVPEGKVQATQFLAIRESDGKVVAMIQIRHYFNEYLEKYAGHIGYSTRPSERRKGYAKEMLRLEDRLKTRFEWGLIADIQRPDYETRMAIIKNKSIRMGMELPDYIIQLIAETITANVRQIEGTVNKIMAFQDLNGDKVDKNTVIRAVKDIFKEKSDILPTADIIIQEVCNFYNIEPAVLRGQGRSKDISMARQIAMYQIRHMTNLSLKEIGAEFGGRDHSTVLNALNRIEDLVKNDP